MKRVKDYINLLPREEKKPYRTASAGFLLGLVFVFAWLGLFGWQAKQQQSLSERLEALTSQNQTLKQQIDAVRKELGITTATGSSPDQAVIIKSLLGERVTWSEVFRQFSQIVPKGLWFDYLEGSTDGKAEIRIRGGAFNYLAVSEFMLSMEKSGYFVDPQLSYARKSVVQGQDVVGFEIISEITRTQEAR